MNRKSVSVSLMFILSLTLLWHNPFAQTRDGYDPDVRPGSSDPMSGGRQSIFRDDELWLFNGNPTEHKGYFHALTPNDTDLTSWSDRSDNHTYLDTEFALVHSRPPAWSSASGRILNPKIDQVAYAFYRTDGELAVELWEYPARKNGWVKIDGTTTKNYQSVGVAVGDTDRAVEAVGSENYYHEEIVVARLADDNGGVTAKVSVLDRNLVVLASAMVPTPTDFTSQKVSVVTADLDADGVVEFVVGQLAVGWDKMQLDVFRLLTAEDNSHSLEKVSTITVSPKLGQTEVFNIASGDFNGDSKEDIAVGEGGSIHLYDADANLNLVSKKVFTGDVDPYHQRMTAGLFKFDPGAGYGISRRQLAFFINDDSWSYLRVYAITSLWEVEEINKHDYNSILGSLNSITAGNFLGHNDASTAKMDIAISYVAYEDSRYTPYVKIIGSQPAGLKELYTWKGSSLSGRVATLVQAVDNDGDSYRVGVPAHIVIENIISLDYLIQEPPKHVDYLPVDYTDPSGAWKIFDISGSEDFYVEMRYGQEQSVDTTSENTSSSSMGSSTEVDAGATLSGGFGDIAEASVSVDVNKKTGYDFQASQSSYNSTYGTRSISYSNQTNIDDNVHAKIHVIDIWRYPVYALSVDDDTKNGFQEIIMPGAENIVSAGAGKDHPDWYQPVHQNRNILSYPHFVTEQTVYKPADLGSFTLPDKTRVTDIMNAGAAQFWNGNQQTIGVEWTAKAGHGDTKSYEHTMSSSLDITVGQEAKVGFFGAGVEEHSEVTVSFDSSASWGGSVTENSENSSSTGVTINVPKGSGADYGYAFQSAIYISSGGGTFKVAHASDPLGGQGSDDWKHYYGGSKIDPALNLPNRFVYHSADAESPWTLNEENSRKKMRGFFMKDTTPNPISGKHGILGTSPTDGDLVKLCARVYNHVLYQQTDAFKVNFYYIAFDNQTAEEVGQRLTQDSMEVSIPSLDGISRLDGAGYAYEGQEPMTEVCVDWDTTGLSALEVDGNHYSTYRFYVIVDKDDDIPNEIHDWKDAGGNLIAHGNNEGYWPWKNAIQVVPDDNTKANMHPLSEIDISLHTLSLAVLKDGVLTNVDGTALEAGKVYDLRAHIQTDGTHPHYRSAIFYEGDPRDGGRAFSTRLIFGVTETDSYIWTEYNPKGAGEREIWVKVIEDVDEIMPGNNLDKLIVNVTGDSDACMNPRLLIDGLRKFPPGSNTLCQGSISITTLDDVIIDADALATFESPAIHLMPGFRVRQKGEFFAGAPE